MTQSILLSRVPLAAHGYLAARLHEDSNRPVLHICANDRQLEQARQFIAAYRPDIRLLSLPAWDCLPYDRLSPAPAIVAARLATLSALAQDGRDGRNGRDGQNGLDACIVLTTLSAAMQKLPPRDVFAQAGLWLATGEQAGRERLLSYLAHHGYRRVGKVMEPGEFAVRGGLIDLFPPGSDDALRLDFFAEEIESIKPFDPLSQRSHGTLERLELHPMNEILLNEQTIAQFRSGYRERFGAVTRDDPLYEAISAGRAYAGMEHWLPLFYEQCDTVFDYLPGAILSYDAAMEQIYRDRVELLQDYYQARRDTPASADGPPYHPLEPSALYLLPEAWQAALERCDRQGYTTLNDPSGSQAHDTDAAPSFAPKPGESPEAPYERLREQAAQESRPLILACYSSGSQTRIAQILADLSIVARRTQSFAPAVNGGRSISLCVLPLENGFSAPDFLLLSEQDLLGERIIRTTRRARQADAFIAEAASLGAGELIVHREHGIGRFEGLVTLEAGGAKHDCLKLVYADDARLFLPVVNMELISRYGSDTEGATLDKLGSVSWQKRKAAMKQRIKLAAEQLLKIAARRATREAAELRPEPHSYSEFCARFPYSETEDQLRAIEDVLADLASGRPTDRLICGDVGFGKTEVALRAAFVAATGALRKQVAVIAPTTLLARQHYQNFRQRFEGFGVTVRLLSRLVPAKEQTATKAGLKDGSVDIVIGTHALLSKHIAFADLGLVIVDEEQHFGVAQKERLKQWRANIHVLTLSATPIPRTLQMALSGVRELSLITTPPVDRLAVRSFVMPYDGITVKEAILREFHRGGKVFYVTPHIRYLDELQTKLKALVPELKLAVAHGQMPARALEDIMQGFYDGQYDLLLSTAIIESGLDVPSANTMIIDHAELFGLAQLYQLRGRVGRGKTRAYAYLTTPAKKRLSEGAVRRLEVMSQLDTLGAGFTLASHDMDIRGAGNLLGEEQSGHVREVGVELYQHMLEETIGQLKQGGDGDTQSEAEADDWSPSINLGASMLIPEAYVEALDLRMQLYRRLAGLNSEAEIESFAAELIDRFGPLPPEVEQLIKVLHIKRQCRQAGIERIDTGPKGAVLSFRGNRFARPEALLHYITQHPKRFKIRHDQKLVLMAGWRNPAQQFAQIRTAVAEIAALL